MVVMSSVRRVMLPASRTASFLRWPGGWQYKQLRLLRGAPEARVLQAGLNFTDRLLQRFLDVAIGAVRHPERDVVGVDRVGDVQQAGEALGHRDHDDVEQEGGDDGPLRCADAAQLPFVL